MSIFAVLATFLTICLVFVDSIFLPKASRKALRWMTIFYLFILIFIWFPTPFFAISRFLGVGRPVDILVYFWREIN